MAEIPDDALQFRFSRASGPGGQHVNKTATRVEAILDVISTNTLTELERARVLQQLASRITRDGQLIVASETSRSQLRNREDAARKLRNLVNATLKRPKTRKKKRVPRAVKKKRVDDKKRRGDVKAMRRPPRAE